MDRHTALPAAAQAELIMQASPAPHWLSLVQDVVPHLPHEEQMAVPLISLWHALKRVALLGLHPL